MVGPISILGAMIYFIRKSISVIRNKLEENRRLQKVMKHFVPSRKAIGESFLSLSTDNARNRYLKWVELHSREFRDKMSSTNNQWPENKRPNFDNDSSSTYLAQLDEKWLNLSD